MQTTRRLRLVGSHQVAAALAVGLIVSSMVGGLDLGLADAFSTPRPIRVASAPMATTHATDWAAVGAWWDARFNQSPRTAISTVPASHARGVDRADAIAALRATTRSWPPTPDGCSCPPRMLPETDVANTESWTLLADLTPVRVWQ
jgi:hypothetical protein